MAFEQVIGQQEARQRLAKMVDEQRLPHAIMLCGPAGCGKLALAVDFAKVLLSQASDSRPHAANLQAMLSKLEHPDLHFTYPTIKLPSMGSDHKPVSDDFAKEWHELIMAGPYFTMNEWLEQMGGENQQAIITAGESDELIRKLSLKSSQGGYKVSIVWLPERMNMECANKMLKLLEEPPLQTVFLMVCEEPERLLETIRSRVQRIDVKKIADDDVRQALMERRGLDESTAQRIARMANGNWNKATELLAGENESNQYFEEYKILMRMAYLRHVKELKHWSEHVHTDYGRERQRAMLAYFQRLTRENFMYNFHHPELNYMTVEEENFAKNFASYINEKNVVEMNELFEQAGREIAQNTTAKIVLFDMALNIIILLLRK